MLKKATAYWLDLVDYDIETAEAMYSTSRWLYVGFMCHQVIEKMLKAYWCEKCDTMPPYIHNHKRLAVGSGIYEQMSEEQRLFIEDITTYNIEARYPADKELLAHQLNRKACRHIIDTTKELQQWIKAQL